VIANGDIVSAENALDMLENTGADGIMIARGAVGNPFIFAEIAARLGGNPYSPPTLAERAETALYQLALAIEEKGELRAVCEARKQIALYMHGFRGSAALRARINRAESLVQVRSALEDFLAQPPRNEIPVSE